jgi:hypothetical protein
VLIDVDTPLCEFADYWNRFLGSQGPAPVFAMSLGEVSRERIRDRRPIRSGGSIHTDRASVGRARLRAPLTMADVAGRWNCVSIAAAILLACYLGLAIWALAAPSEYDPQQGMAIGFIIPVALVLGGLLLLLWRAVVRGRRWLVWTIFVLAAYPAVMLAAQFVYEHFLHTPG